MKGVGMEELFEKWKAQASVMDLELQVLRHADKILGHNRLEYDIGLRVAEFSQLQECIIDLQLSIISYNMEQLFAAEDAIR